MYPKYKLTITFNSYVGNYNRELMSYVFGYYYDGLQDWVEDLYNKAFAELQNEMPNDDFSELLHHFHDEYDRTASEISDSGKAIIVYFDEDVSKYFDLIVNRLKKFPEIYRKSFEFADKNVKIVSVNLAEVETVTQELKYIKF